MAMEFTAFSADNLLKNGTGLDAFLLPASILLLTALALLLWRTSTRDQGLPLPAGRLGLPFIGETFQFLNSQKRNASWEFIDDRVAKYGEVFKTRIVGVNTIVPASPAGNKMIFTNENKLVHVDWPPNMVSVLGKRSLIALRGDEVNRIRHAMLTFLRPEALQTYTGKADKSVRSFIKEYWEGHSQVLVYPVMKRFAFAIACELLMSRYDREEQEKLEGPFTIMMKGLMQWPIKLPGTRYSKALAAANMLHVQFQQWIDERRHDMAAGKASSNEDMLSCFLTYVDGDGKHLTDEEIKDNILLLLFAGHDTSTIVMTMVCKFLASNPKIFEEVYKENKEILIEKGPNEPLGWADIKKMKLSWRVVQETMRLQPPAQGGFRVAMNDFEYAGSRIPKGWKIYWSAHSTHRNSKFFEDPFKFDPSRFEGTGPAPYTFVPFGGGPRMCPGNGFARMEAMILIHHLVTRFSWSLVDPHEAISVDPIPYPTKGLAVHLTPRTA